MAPVSRWPSSIAIPPAVRPRTGPAASKWARIGQSWKFDASGNDLGVLWREAGFDDSAWAAGPALFYNGNVIAGEVGLIPTLFNTGVGTNGSALPASARDPHYLLTVSAQNPTNPPAAAIVMAKD